MTDCNTELHALPSLDTVRTALAGRYEIVRVIGHGGMAVVYLAHELKHVRPVAIKVLDEELATDEGRARFRDEVEIVARLQHPNIVPLLDSGCAGHMPFFVMPYVQGEALDSALREGPLSTGDALRLGAQVADALAYAHRHHVAHLDIKPANILLSDDHAMVTDFGIARAVCEGCQEATDMRSIVGTPDYMSPEQALGGIELDGRSDLYSLGAVLFEMITGLRPFGHGPADVVLLRRGREAAPRARDVRPGIPTALDDLVAQLLDGRPDRRPPASAVAARLRDLARGGRARVSSVRTNRVRVAGAAVVVVAAIMTALAASTAFGRSLDRETAAASAHDVPFGHASLGAHADDPSRC